MRKLHRIPQSRTERGVRPFQPHSALTQPPLGTKLDSGPIH